MLGTCLVIASGCVFNNYLDRHIDAKMVRTQQRAIVSGAVSGRIALVYGLSLGTAGFAVLSFFTNLLTVIIGIFGIAAYVLIYGYAKRRTIYGTLIGTISGATPPLAGYVAVSGRIDTTAVILFMILVFWQMPHFYSISLFRLSDYRKAKIPVLPAVKGELRTKIEIIVYALLFSVASLSLTVLSTAGYTYAVVMILVSFLWLATCIKGLYADDTIKWARKVFGQSLLVLGMFSLMASIDTWLL